MRISKSGQSAADIVMQTNEADLARIFWEYGEEKASRRIAKAICRVREETEITSTNERTFRICMHRKRSQVWS